MSYNSRLFRAYDLLVDIFFSLARVLAAFTMAVVRSGFATTWHSLQTMKIAAFKVVSQLKREYAESYDTHGLSLDHRIGT